MNGTIDLSLQTFQYLYTLSPEEQGEKINFTTIVILTYNELPYTQLCIESIRKYTPKDSYEIIVVDNNSSDGTVPWLKQQEDIKCIFNSTNLGFPVGCNQGIEISKGDSILLLNNDTIVTPNWLNNLDKALYSSEKIGAVGATTNSCSNLQQIPVYYNSIEEMISFSKMVNQSNPNHWDYKSRLVGFCLLIKKSILEEVGELDPIFSPGNYEDDDLSLRILSSGHYLLLCRDVFIHHFGSVSFKKDQASFNNHLYENMLKLNNKWGFSVSYSNNVRYDIIELMSSPPEKEINVLEIGCGTGATLLQIKNKFRNSTIYGIEIDENSSKISKELCNTLCGNIEVMELSYPKDFFDFIILGDVLEHLINPWELLERLKFHLKPSGNIIASIPNINHITVLRGVLNGVFPYATAGILDKTHLRFFTLTEIRRLFDFCGYKISCEMKNAIPISEEDSSLIESLCALTNDKMRNEYTAYQYRIVANKAISKERYNEEALVKIKYMLMRIDNTVNTEETIDFIFDFYINNEDYLYLDIKHILTTNIINKHLVLQTLIDEANERNLFDFSEILGGLEYEL